MCPCGPLLVQVFRKADRHDPRLTPDAVCPRLRPILHNVPREPRPAQCPACGATTVARIIWGLVVEPVPGKVVYGGCCIPETPAKWACETCEHQWGRDEETDDTEPRSE